MVRVIFGQGLPSKGETRVEAVTVGDALERLAGEHAWVAQQGVRVFVDGVDAARLEGGKTPLGPEDTLVLVWASPRA